MKNTEKRNGLVDYFASCELLQNPLIGWLPIVTIALLSGMFLPFVAKLKAAKANTVIVYAAQDQIYSEPILKQFTAETGIKVRAVYDSEAVKTVGLANRLLAERNRPQCDLFWGNEELRTRQLAAKEVFRETNGWIAFGYRSRRIVINTNKLQQSAAPRTLTELTNSAWKGKLALAYPVFGTTATHFLALRQHWGSSNWLEWCRALQRNKPFVVDGNSVVVNLVGRGESWIGLTDSDDIAAGKRQSMPIIALPLNEESLLIPNTIGLVHGGPNPTAAERLFEYLKRPATVEKLVAAGALEGGSALHTRTLSVDWNGLLAEIDPATAELKEIFLR